MERAMEKAEDIDEMAQIHVKYVAKLQERALLSSELKLIHKAIVEMLDLSILFAKTLTDLDKSNSISTRPSAPRRKSSAPLLVIAESSESEQEAEDGEDVGSRRIPTRAAGRTPRESLQMIDKEFARLLPFITAGLRSVGRVGAEPMWEQLADRLDWEGKKDKY
jgi:gamma-tubulin complex component 5